MANREKYIEVLSKTAKTVKEFNEDAPIMISLECVEDILELLKEQEAKSVESIQMDRSDKWGADLTGYCPSCKRPLKNRFNTRFCGECGQAVKWE